jgi:hypothetical protein
MAAILGGRLRAFGAITHPTCSSRLRLLVQAIAVLANRTARMALRPILTAVGLRVNTPRHGLKVADFLAEGQPTAYERNHGSLPDCEEYEVADRTKSYGFH